MRAILFKVLLCCAVFCCANSSMRAHAQTCSVVESFKCSDIAGGASQLCAGISCGFFGGNTLKCPPSARAGFTHPDRELGALRSAFPGESGNTLFSSSTVVCVDMFPCTSSQCEEYSVCGIGAGPSPYISATQYVPDPGTSCEVNYGGGGYGN